jgi:hypothetical protein
MPFLLFKKKVKRWKIKKRGELKKHPRVSIYKFGICVLKNKDRHVTAREIGLGVCNTVVIISIMSTSSQTPPQAFLPVLLSLIDCREGRTGSGVALVSLASYMATNLCIFSLSD